MLYFSANENELVTGARVLVRWSFVCVCIGRCVFIITIVIIVISVIQGIYNYIPETIHVSGVYTCLQFVLHLMLFRL
jgi:hypothetical protein